MNSILIIVVTYNRLNLLKECIKSICEQTFKGYDLLVINNKSTDGTDRYLMENNISHVNLEKNTGGAGGFYYGIREAVIRGYKYVWVMDDDTIPGTDSLEILVNIAENGIDFGFLSSRVNWIDSDLCRSNYPGDLFVEDASDVDCIKNGIVRCKWATFVSMFVNCRYVKELGLPIKEFFIWGDDIEFSQRLSSKVKCYFAYKSRVTHKTHTNLPMDIISDDKERIDRYFYLFRNQCYIARKKGMRDKLKNFAHTFAYIPNIIKQSNCAKFKRIIVLLKGYFMGLVFNPRIEFVDKSLNKE